MRPAETAPIHYRIHPKNPAAHLFEVTLTVTDPDPAGQRFMLPVWIPGSYMIREFARHIVGIRAESDGAPLACAKVDKASWQCAPAGGPLALIYEIYAWDLSVRAAHLDETHGFYNGTSVFLLPFGKEQAACEIEIAAPAGEPYSSWRIATSLHQTQALARPAGDNTVESRASAVVSLNDPGVPLLAPKSFGSFSAASYDELIDHPVEMGSFTHAAFDSCGVPHHVAITGRHRADMDRLCADLKKICEYQIRLFEPESAAAPMPEYWFLVMAVGEGYGGLEHRASTALICNRDDLPLAGEKKVSGGYRRFLGLASHEYFHAWNVKRIKPEVFTPYDLTRETYTRQLWFFEGFTSYYDDLTLVRTRLIEPLAYLEMIAENIGRVMSQSGRFRQSVAESSFDAWVKYYRQDENSPNAIVSYYQKGAMVALALDLTIRQRTGGARSLDDVMRALWAAHGKSGAGVPEGGVQAAAEQTAGIALGDFFAHAVEGTGDLDLAPLFASVGIDLAWKVPGQARPDGTPPATLGAKIGGEANGDARLLHVFDDGAAQRAGLSAGDTVIAVDGLRVTSVTLERRLRTYAPDSRVQLSAFRRDELMTFQVTLQAQAPQTCSLTMRDTPIDAKARRNAWLLG
ncbi:MAG: PDZ domain-containing protein [Betaproteobacteria bacterium]